MGAIKAGVSVVTFSEQDNKDAVHEVLKNSGARGLIFSPETKHSQDGETRQEQFESLIPELANVNPGDRFSLSAYPELKNIAHIGHHTISGVNKFKDSMFYANTALTNLSLPENKGESNVFEVYANGRLSHSFTSEELLNQAQRVYDRFFASSDKVVPVSTPLDLQTPFGFACFLGNNVNGRKIFVPSNYNMTRIIRAIEVQQSTELVCDAEFFGQRPSEAKKAEYHNLLQNVQKVIVAEDGQSSAGSSEILSGATMERINAYSLQ